MFHWQLVEELTDETASATDVSTYVYGNYIDELIQYRDEVLSTPEDYFAHHDDLFSVTLLTDGDGEVVQRYRYGDYGHREVLDANGSPTVVTGLIDHGFTGRLHDDLVGLIEYRHRWMQPGTGTFVQRDPLGYVDGCNVLTYARSSPSSQADAFGLTPNPNVIPDRDWGIPPNVPSRGNCYRYAVQDPDKGNEPHSENTGNITWRELAWITSHKKVCDAVRDGAVRDGLLLPNLNGD